MEDPLHITFRMIDPAQALLAKGSEYRRPQPMTQKQIQRPLVSSFQQRNEEVLTLGPCGLYSPATIASATFGMRYLASDLQEPGLIRQSGNRASKQLRLLTTRNVPGGE